MRFLLILMIASYVLVPGISRPHNTEENGDSVAEAEYDSEGNEPEDDSENEISTANEQVKRNTYNQDVEAADTDSKADESQPENEQAVEALNANYDEVSANFKVPDNKPSEKGDSQDEKNDSNIDIDEYEVKREPVKLTDSQVAQSVESETAPLEYEGNDIEYKRSPESGHAPRAEGRFLFNNIQNRPERNGKQGFNSEAPDSNDRARVKQHPNAVQTENKNAVRGKHGKKRRFHLGRDRRDTNEGLKENNNVANVSPGEDLEGLSLGDEEAAIKRHVKKLSTDELEELLTSLSEEKRKLLKKIMSSEYENGDILDKREITKKAGSLQDNSNIDGDISDLKGSSAQSTPSAKVPEPTDMKTLSTTPASPSKESSAPKTNSESVAEVNTVGDTTLNNNQASLNSDSSLNTIQASNINSDSSLNTIQVSNIPASENNKKTENKREANTDNITNSDKESIEHGLASRDSNLLGNNCICQDEDLSELTEDESSSHEENNYLSKREASENEGDYRDLIRSLEESFPKLDTYDEPKQYYGSDIAPLIRVKRKNTRSESHLPKKRRAALLHDANVAYFPSRASEEEEEGSEFDEDSFYDRNSNLAGSVDDGLANNAETAARPSDSKRLSESQHCPSDESEKENIESDTSLGSDTDGVLSGIEGVDDNSMLMSSDIARNRRGSENNPRLVEDQKKLVTENYLSASNIPIGSDVFGALHQNEDSAVGRHKRVRHLKHRRR